MKRFDLTTNQCRRTAAAARTRSARSWAAAALALLLIFVCGNKVWGQGVNDGIAAWRGAGAPHDETSSEPHPAVARIIVPEESGTSYGSGTLVDVRDEYGLVVTNWHVVRDATDRIEVVFPNGFRSFARALKVDRDWDLAALVIWRPKIEPVAIAAVAPQPGDVLSISGHGRGTYREVSGRCTQYLAPDANSPNEMVEVNVQARQGDSGGPIFNQQGELAGVLFGASYGTTMGSYAGRVRDFLASVAPELNNPEQTALAARLNGVQSLAPAAGEAAQPNSTNTEQELGPSHQSNSLTQSEAMAQSETGSSGFVVNSNPSRPPESELNGRQSTFPPSYEATGLAENPPRRKARSDEAVPAGEADPEVLAALPTGAAEQSAPISWREIAGDTIFEQAKTVLAMIGALCSVICIVRVVGG